MITITEDCMSCGMCIDECPCGAISAKGGSYAGYMIDRDICVECRACLDFDCPADAIKPM